MGPENSDAPRSLGHATDDAGCCLGATGWRIVTRGRVRLDSWSRQIRESAGRRLGRSTSPQKEGLELDSTGASR